MHVFISAGEPSGDLHGANLIRALKARRPGLGVAGLGGPNMAAAGAELHYPLTDLAVMWLGRALLNLPTFFKVGRRAEVHFRSAKPAALVIIDYPGFHWALAKRAHRAGVPVYYFVPPQLWAWAGWRVAKMRKWVKCVLTALPFEEEWYRQRGVRTHYIGHPYFDEIAGQRIDPGFVAAHRRAGAPIVALLPGSRNQEVTANFPMMVAAAAKVRAAVPAARFLVPAFKDSQARAAREMLAGSGLPIEILVGRTPDVIETADACVAVSGSVGLELMCRLKPTVVVYKGSHVLRWLADRLMTCEYISLVNLLAGEAVFPEFATARDESDAIARHVVEWLTHPAAKETAVGKLRALRDRVAHPGSCERAAEFLLREIGDGTTSVTRRAA